MISATWGGTISSQLSSPLAMRLSTSREKVAPAFCQDLHTDPHSDPPIPSTVTKLRASDGAVRATIPVGGGPNGAAVSRGKIWVTNYFDDTISILRDGNDAELRLAWRFVR